MHHEQREVEQREVEAIIARHQAVMWHPKALLTPYRHCNKVPTRQHSTHYASRRAQVDSRWPLPRLSGISRHVLPILPLNGTGVKECSGERNTSTDAAVRRDATEQLLTHPPFIMHLLTLWHTMMQLHTNKLPAQTSPQGSIDRNAQRCGRDSSGSVPLLCHA